MQIWPWDAPEEEESKPAQSGAKGHCFSCQEEGHVAASCPKGSSDKTKVSGSHVSLKVVPKLCPSYKGQHSFTGSCGNTLYRMRLSSCDDWKQKFVQEKVAYYSQPMGVLSA